MEILLTHDASPWHAEAATLTVADVLLCRPLKIPASVVAAKDALHKNERALTVQWAPSNPPYRLTLTLGVTNHAAVVVFPPSGDAQTAITQRILEPTREADRQLPAALLRPARGRLIQLLDYPAAAKLTGQYRQDHPRPA
jgi:6-phosphogluconolactonase/glucosamine-6-phosphate isomerase/deaminase